jgi:hypothetical protein
MIEDTGRTLQREKGIENPTGDFGLELVAGFNKGSVLAKIAITRDVQIGRKATERVIRAVKWLETMKGRPQRSRRVKQPEGIAAQFVTWLHRIAAIQKVDKTEMHLELRNGKRKVQAVFGEDAIASAETLRTPQFEMDGVSLYGKLYELRDSAPEEGEGTYFWGELRRENGEVWRATFKSSDFEQVVPLFRKQVAVVGKATYYAAQNPKIAVEQITQDVDRDYETAFDELYGCNKELYKASLDSLLKEIRGVA